MRPIQKMIRHVGLCGRLWKQRISREETSDLGLGLALIVFWNKNIKQKFLLQISSTVICRPFKLYIDRNFLFQAVC